MQSAAQAIGLKAELESTSAANYINFFIDPEARKNVDGFFTINYGDYADPAALLSTLVLKDGSQNYGGYDNPEVTKEMEAARGEADDTKRAEHVVAAQKIITEEVAWIPMTLPGHGAGHEQGDHRGADLVRLHVRPLAVVARRSGLARRRSGCCGSCSGGSRRSS